MFASRDLFQYSKTVLRWWPLDPWSLDRKVQMPSCHIYTLHTFAQRQASTIRNCVIEHNAGTPATATKLLRKPFQNLQFMEIMIGKRHARASCAQHIASDISQDPTGVSADDGRSAIEGGTYWKREAFAIHLNFIDELPIRSGQPK